MTSALLVLAVWAAPAPRAAAETEIAAFDGRMLLPRPPGWRVSAGADGWLILEGPRASVALRETAREDALPRPRDCAPGEPREERLANGWKLVYTELSCRAPDGAPQLQLSGLLAASADIAFAVSAQYAEPTEKKALLAWLGRARRPEPPRAPPWLRGLAFLAAGGLALSSAAFAASALRGMTEGRTRAGAAPARSGSLFPMDVRERYLSLGRRFLVLDRIGRRHTAVCRHWPSILARGGAAAAACSVLFAAAAFLLGLPLRPSVILYGSAKGVLAGAAAVAAGALLAPWLAPRLLLLDEDGTFLLEVRRRAFGWPRSEYSIRSPAGAELAVLSRRGRALGAKRWLAADSRGGTVLALEEAGPIKALLRRLLGHLWGLLRSELRLRSAGGAGALERAGGIRNRFFLRLDPQAERSLDPRVAVAAALFVEVAEPDRWHPWPF